MKDKLIAEERMKVFSKDIQHWKNYDYVVINDNLQDCFNEICSLIDSEINNSDNIAFIGDLPTTMSGNNILVGGSTTNHKFLYAYVGNHIFKSINILMLYTFK